MSMHEMHKMSGGKKMPDKIMRKGPKGHSEEHPGFEAVAGKMMRKQGISRERAERMLAATTRGASPAAKKRNPRLRRVRGD